MSATVSSLDLSFFTLQARRAAAFASTAAAASTFDTKSAGAVFLRLLVWLEPPSPWSSVRSMTAFAFKILSTAAAAVAKRRRCSSASTSPGACAVAAGDVVVEEEADDNKADFDELKEDEGGGFDDDAGSDEATADAAVVAGLTIEVGFSPARRDWRVWSHSTAGSAAEVNDDDGPDEVVVLLVEAASATDAVASEVASCGAVSPSVRRGPSFSMKHKRAFRVSELREFKASRRSVFGVAATAARSLLNSSSSCASDQGLLLLLSLFSRSGCASDTIGSGCFLFVVVPLSRSWEEPQSFDAPLAAAADGTSFFLLFRAFCGPFAFGRAALKKHGGKALPPPVPAVWAEKGWDDLVAAEEEEDDSVPRLFWRALNAVWTLWNCSVEPPGLSGCAASALFL